MAEEIAARTVNKERREAGETKAQRKDHSPFPPSGADASARRPPPVVEPTGR